MPAWGIVFKGNFQGKGVGVKRVYQSIPQPTTVDCIHRETSTLAQVHHPNLVFFIAAVIDDQTGPMMITKILDTNLHTTYERNILGSNKLWIFQDVTSALRLQESIIHRNVSSAKAFLKAVVNNRRQSYPYRWANLVRYATTPDEGVSLLRLEWWHHPPLKKYNPLVKKKQQHNINVALIPCNCPSTPAGTHRQYLTKSYRKLLKREYVERGETLKIHPWRVSAVSCRRTGNQS